MEILPSLLGFISSRVKVLKQNVSDLVTDTSNALEKTAANTAQTINESLKDPMSLVGTGTFIGKGAKLFNLEAAGKARNMEALGNDKRYIHEETGTWLGHLDSKARQEISDAKAFVRKNNLVTDMNAERFSSDAPAQFSRDGVKLGDILDHPKLFEAYPDLKNIDVLYGHGTKERTGRYDPRDDSILVLGKDADEALSILIHEIQHAIQKREKWSPGASTDSVPFDKRTAQLFQEGLIDLKRRPDVDWTDKPAIKQLYDDMKRRLYKRVIGEADARLSQKRAAFTDEELRQFYPGDFYDIPLKDMLL